MRSITRATIVYFVASGLFAAAAVALHLLGPDVADALGGGNLRTIVVVIAWALTVAAALLLYHGLMRAAQEQDAAEQRRAQDRQDWQARLQPPPRSPRP